MDKSLVEKSVEFLKDFFVSYFIKCDSNKIVGMLHPDVTCIGLGPNKLPHNYEDALELIKNGFDSWHGKYTVLDECCQAVLIDDKKCLVFGDVKLAKAEENDELAEMLTHFSALCYFENNSFKLHHIHFSHLDVVQSNKEYDKKGLIENYDKMLKRELEERTHMLSEKTKELENITNNILGGVQICGVDDGYTIQYINDGFCRLVGYTSDEIATVFENKHVNLIYPPDVEKTIRNVFNNDLNPNRYSVEYRIVHKDGSLVWVLDNGTIFVDSNNVPTHIQCILTDITEQKNHEELLRISEKRYQITMKQVDASVFEYDVVRKELILFEKDASLYDVPSIVPNGPETLIEIGAILPSFVDDYREMYRKIHAGEPFANCFINTRDTNNIIHDFELSLTTIFSSDGVPVHAIGLKKDVSHFVELQKEKKYGKTILDDRHFLFETNITNDTLIYTSVEWLKDRDISTNVPFSSMIKRVTETFVMPEYRTYFMKCFSADYIIEEYKKGRQLITFPYKRIMDKGEPRWFECVINIICDDRNGDFSIRMYNKDIHEQRLKEQSAEKEKLMYDSMVAKAILAYELNLTQDTFIKGHEDWLEQYDLETDGCFSKMIESFADKCVKAENQEVFLHTVNRATALESFSKGENLLSCQYQRTNKFGHTIWVECTLHIYEDPYTGDIKGYAYVEDINETKCAELDLKFRAEHDVMTDLLNKDTTENMMKNYLTSDDGTEKKHALLMIDIDNFKSVNDVFGHPFGDSVITEIAKKIRAECRSDDIVGRVGGDEFCALIKNIQDIENVNQKAKLLCEKVFKVYQQDGKSCTVSASIGIAFYPDSGTDYGDIFEAADRALYRAKENGRNQYCC